MIRYLLALAGALIMHACAMPALAQTVTSATRIPDTDGDRKIKLVAFASNVVPPVKKNTPVYGPCNDAAPFVYSLTPACPVAPVPVPDPTPTPVSTVDTALTSDGSFFIRSAQIVVGFGAGGSIGTRNVRPPAGWAFSPGFGGLGFLLAPTATEISLPGGATDAFGVTANGAYDYNGEGTGLVTIAGAWTSDGTWTGIGRKTGVRVTQRVTVDGKRLHTEVTLTNPTAVTMTRVRFRRSTDWDLQDSYKTVASFPAPNVVKTRLSNGTVTYLGTSDTRAIATAWGWIVEDPYLPSFYDAPVRQTTSAAISSHLVWKLPDLASGESVTVAFDLGVE